jgi:hypothetical protein
MCSDSPRLHKLVIRVVMFSWAIVLGEASLAGSVSMGERARHPVGPARAEAAIPGSIDSPKSAQTNSPPPLRAGKRHRKFVPTVLPESPNGDDGTSRDPYDDNESSNDLKVDDESDAPIASIDLTVDYASVPESESVPTSAKTHLPPFVTSKPLRC